jgi:uncharacterized protein YndB with AHSA1/START domain
MIKEKLQITQSQFIPAPIEEVWSFILVDSHMKKLFNADKFMIDSDVGGCIEIPLNIDGQTSLVKGEIGLVYPMTKFYFTWYEAEGIEDDWFHNTMVKITLIKEENGTTIYFEHNGFKRLPIEIQAQVFNKYVKYWGKDPIPKRFLFLFSAERKAN